MVARLQRRLERTCPDFVWGSAYRRGRNGSGSTGEIFDETENANRLWELFGVARNGSPSGNWSAGFNFASHNEIQRRKRDDFSAVWSLIPFHPCCPELGFDETRRNNVDGSKSWPLGIWDPFFFFLVFLLFFYLSGKTWIDFRFFVEIDR